ncbi:type I 3-dehydroquinate dehydratase [Companilactobacillus zhongbaensis]|uniref:type I 3-dehydroquinate dehydratase n=1 Tax=Companilactobacillus zhongbaensis TaxID=2486009 RepID=UPI000F791A74|nr:type I 3-dehydroquinate dehydratase [Companilactobacillus zhongbaensis]
MTNKIVKIGNIELGTGHTKIAVPITGTTKEEILSQAEEVKPAQPDLVEWRVDFFEDVVHKSSLEEIAKQLRTSLGDTPLLTTFRTYQEGGEKMLTDQDYFEIVKNIISWQQTDAIDLELKHDQTQIEQLIQMTSDTEIVTIMSNHDFAETPKQAELVKRLTQMQKAGADVAKIAVMPKISADVLTLLSATQQAHEKLDCPLITMSMGDLGKVTRTAGKEFGSSLTFASVKNSSAPGQIEIGRLRNILDEFETE